MIKNIFIGILLGSLIGVFITSVFMPEEVKMTELFFTKITATSIITGIFCSIYAFLSHSKLQTFLISIIIGAITFYAKYIITGHDFDPLTMGLFVGAMLGGAFAVIKKVTHSIKIYNRLKRLRRNGFYN
ncbi:hypothetical protein MC378_11160 [Polaribacter sp. MSW13]|uniref:Uncharacterized protein n=1 Tax=Polaribacter marinus TaxID=2916838 RepID=A0A9X1VUD3_9FLAO|nr:hypothetical protein [Polaribacter marinus]MCI2229726.1 hypothetical protein [Polaribacter marinus]